MCRPYIFFVKQWEEQCPGVEKALKAHPAWYLYWILLDLHEQNEGHLWNMLEFWGWLGPRPWNLSWNFSDKKKWQMQKYHLQSWFGWRFGQLVCFSSSYLGDTHIWLMCSQFFFSGWNHQVVVHVESCVLTRTSTSNHVCFPVSRVQCIIAVPSTLGYSCSLCMWKRV